MTSSEENIKRLTVAERCPKDLLLVQMSTFSTSLDFTAATVEYKQLVLATTTIDIKVAKTHRVVNNVTEVKNLMLYKGNERNIIQNIFVLSFS